MTQSRGCISNLYQHVRSDIESVVCLGRSVSNIVGSLIAARTRAAVCSTLCRHSHPAAGIPEVCASLCPSALPLVSA